MSMADLKENQLAEITKPAYIRCFDSSGNSRRTTPANVLKQAGNSSGYINAGICSGGKWYRIAKSGVLNRYAGCMLNLGNGYNVNSANGILLYVGFSGYIYKPVVIKIGNFGNKLIDKVRVLHKQSTSEGGMIDIKIYDWAVGSNQNELFISYACNIGLTFQEVEEVSETPDAGYSAEEFSF